MNRRNGFILMTVLLVAPAVSAETATYDEPPVRYSTTQPSDPVESLRARIEAGDDSLESSDKFGPLPSLLKRLGIPVSSQVLVFSKTSLQRSHISPENPRAIYFDDDTYVGFVPGGRVIEVASTDPHIGTTFYTVDQHGGNRGAPSIPVRQIDNCLSCHATNLTRDLPGLVVRSVFPDTDGQPILAAGTFVTTHESPLTERWGGWYVTGPLRAGSMANRVHDDADPSNPKPMPSLDPARQFDASAYLTPHSDAVALLVLGHQVEAHNRFTRATYAVRRALYEEQIIAKGLGETLTPGKHSDSILSRIRHACDPLVEYLLFAKEAPLGGPIAGDTTFAADFSAKGPRDAQGRSLRDFDLNTRLFKYPCSYLIYSASFDNLPAPALEYVYQRLFDVLTGKDTTKPFAHLSPADRKAILEILRDTKKDLPAYWR